MNIGLRSRPFLDKLHDVAVETDVTYGVGGVGYVEGEGPSRYRALKLDIYTPKGPFDRPRPALIMAFGGAFHRGSKGAEVFAGENPSTAMAEYCREFARRGYVCFSIDYRLMQEDPDPGPTPFLLPNQPQNRDRIDFVRNLMGLPPSTPQMMSNVLEAACDDMAAAVHFVRSRAQSLGVDIDRIAIGGFSAGAATALNAAFGERVPVKAVVSLSGRIGPVTLRTYVSRDTGGPATLMFFGEQDLPGILGGREEMRDYLTGCGIANQVVTVPGANHFYLGTATVTRPDGSATDVETLMAEFLHDKLGLSQAGTMTVELLQAFADAWNAHDIDALMSFMSEDCVFEANAGAEIIGTSFIGRDEVRRGYLKAFETFPDARWNDPKHFVSGDRGASEWIFTGTDRSGQRVEVAGCDLFQFRGDKIVVKNSFRKRPA